MKGNVNIVFAENYDQEDDVYYVTFKTGEPSYVVEVDDILLLEVGMFTHMPTGFRILNYSKHDIGGVAIVVQKAKKAIDSITREIPSMIRSRETQMERAIEKALA